MPGSFSGGAGPAIALRRMTAAVLCQTVRHASYDSELEHNNCDHPNFEESHGRTRGLLKSRVSAQNPQ
jgi:hypothetical protein